MRKEEQEVTASLPAAKEISMDAAMTVVLSGLDAIFTMKTIRKWHLKLSIMDLFSH